MAEPGDSSEALIRVHRAGICGTDLEIVRGYKGFRGILGHEFVGEVVASPNSEWLGKRVCGEINVWCGECDACRTDMKSHCRQREVLGIREKPGAFAEYLSLPPNNLHEVPDTVDDDEAVFAEPLAAAFEILEQVAIARHDTVAVLGDGRLGNLCAQVLKMATENVIVFGRHERKLELLRAAGIEATATRPQTDYDVVIEATGSSSGIGQAVGAVRPRGKLVLKSTVAGQITADLSSIVVNELTVVGSRCGPFPKAIRALQEGSISVKPLIDAVYPLSDGVAAFDRAGRSESLKVLIDPRR